MNVITVFWKEGSKEVIGIGETRAFQSYEITPAGLVLESRRTRVTYPWHRINAVEESLSP